jgi:hypothetical protein
MESFDPYINLPLRARIQLLAFEAELAHLPRSLIAAIWTAFENLDSLSGVLESSSVGLAIQRRRTGHVTCE